MLIKKIPFAVLLATSSATLLALSACGSGPNSPVPPKTITSGENSNYANQCDANNTYAPLAQRNGSLSAEKKWVHAYLNDTYLWYKQMPTVDADAAIYSNRSNVFTSLNNYFDALLTPATTASGKKIDQFSFIYPKATFDGLFQSGATVGYGFDTSSNKTTPRNIRVVTVQAGSPAAISGVQRGDEIVSVDGISSETIVDSEIAILYAGLFPKTTGKTHTIVFKRNGSNVSTQLTASNIITNPVPQTTVLNVGGQKVGYLVFNDHIATAETPLINAINQFKTAGVSDLVIDLRYNGGGYLYIASELAYMIAGAARTQGKIFNLAQYNDKQTAATAAARKNAGFYNTSCNRSANGCTTNASLPTLNLGRVFVITTANTCSASEAIINGLRGVDITVNTIGGTSCGKPYGFEGDSNCGISYYPIQFKGSNNKGFGDYADGFTATCPANDDLGKSLGDTSESSLATALYLRSNGICPANTLAASKAVGIASVGESTERIQRDAIKESAFIVPLGR